MMRIFQLPTGTFKIDERELEDIRQAVIRRLAAEKDETSHSLKEELQKAIVILGPEDSRLGPWALTEREGALALVRIPPRSAVNYLFVAKLAREKDRWMVTEFFQEIMTAR